MRSFISTGIAVLFTTCECFAADDIVNPADVTFRSDVAALRSLKNQGNLVGFEELATQLEKKYRESDPELYSNVVITICSTLSGSSFGIANIAITNAIEDRFARNAFDNKKDMTALQRFMMLTHLHLNKGHLENAADWPDQRRVAELLKAWSAIETLIDPKFNPQDVPMRISSGALNMNASQKREFDLMVKTNHEKTLYYNEQSALREIQRLNERRVLDFASAYYATSGLSAADIRKELENSKINDTAARSIIDNTGRVRRGE